MSLLSSLASASTLFHAPREGLHRRRRVQGQTVAPSLKAGVVPQHLGEDQAYFRSCSRHLVKEQTVRARVSPLRRALRPAKHAQLDWAEAVVSRFASRGLLFWIPPGDVGLRRYPGIGSGVRPVWLYLTGLAEPIRYYRVLLNHPWERPQAPPRKAHTVVDDG